MAYPVLLLFLIRLHLSGGPLPSRRAKHPLKEWGTSVAPETAKHVCFLAGKRQPLRFFTKVRFLEILLFYIKIIHLREAQHK